MIVVENLHKHFGGFHAVDGASLRIEQGSITGLIGPNGAVRLLTGLEGETARLSVHQAAGDLMLNYTGICEAVE